MKNANLHEGNVKIEARFISYNSPTWHVDCLTRPAKEKLTTPLSGPHPKKKYIFDSRDETAMQDCKYW